MNIIVLQSSRFGAEYVGSIPKSLSITIYYAVVNFFFNFALFLQLFLHLTSRFHLFCLPISYFFQQIFTNIYSSSGNTVYGTSCSFVYLTF
jgi:hypothetical protein